MAPNVVATLQSYRVTSRTSDRRPSGRRKPKPRSRPSPRARAIAVSSMGRKDAMSGASLTSRNDVNTNGSSSSSEASRHEKLHDQQRQVMDADHRSATSCWRRRRTLDEDSEQQQLQQQQQEQSTRHQSATPTDAESLRLRREEELRQNAQLRLHELRQLYQHLKAQEDETEEEDNDALLLRTAAASSSSSSSSRTCRALMMPTGPSSMPRCPSPPPGMNDAQLCLQKILWTHYHSLQMLGMEPPTFLETKLSTQQLELVLRPVVSAVDMMTAEHFGIRPPTSNFAQTLGEIQYWKIWESDTVDMGIFFMPPHSKIPLHNHPGMSVVSRVLYGSVNVKSYQMVAEEEIAQLPPDERQKAEGNIVWAEQTRDDRDIGISTMWLDPLRHNFHCIEASGDIGCALLDVMIPPYNNTDRDCHHYQILDKHWIAADQSKASTRKEVFRFLETVGTDELDMSGSSPRVTTAAPPPAPAPAPPSAPVTSSAAAAAAAKTTTTISVSSSVGPTQ